MLKIDLENFFDRLKWSFVHNLLSSLNFRPALITLIMNYITTSSIFVLINDIHTLFFSPIRGTRQGDILSP